MDGDHAFGLMALPGNPARTAAPGFCVRTSAGRAEVAFTVADPLQGPGIASIILAQMAEAARSMGIDVFEATVLPENRAMLEVFSASGYPVHTRSEPGVVTVEFPTEITADVLMRFQEG
ncbi:MAG TPA: hypothetical protein VNF75_01860 [Candidatus Dormibacteraeota bacterium]|nr:hypothetical protein [Candidatus Dormibacteraeota bacterium]